MKSPQRPRFQQRSPQEESLAGAAAAEGRARMRSTAKKPQRSLLLPMACITVSKSSPCTRLHHGLKIVPRHALASRSQSLPPARTRRSGARWLLAAGSTPLPRGHAAAGGTPLPRGHAAAGRWPLLLGSTLAASGWPLLLAAQEPAACWRLAARRSRACWPLAAAVMIHAVLTHTESKPSEASSCCSLLGSTLAASGWPLLLVARRGLLAAPATETSMLVNNANTLSVLVNNANTLSVLTAYRALEHALVKVVIRAASVASTGVLAFLASLEHHATDLL